MVMQSMRRGAFGSVLKFVLFGLLVLAVAGLVLMDVNGVFRKGGVSNSDVVRVDDEEISLQKFDKILRRALARIGLTPQQAYQVGYVDDVLTSEIRALYVMLESERLGLYVGPELVRRKIAEIVAPMVEEGGTLQGTFEQILVSQGLTETDFIEGIRREMTGDVLIEATGSGFFDVSGDLARDLFLFQNQTRDIRIVSFPDTDIQDIEPANDEQLQRIYEAQKNTTFAVPEYRHLRIAVIDSSDVGKSIDITEDAEREYYEANSALYQIPQQHVFEQAIVKTEEDAQKLYGFASEEGVTLEGAVKKMSDENITYTPPLPFELDIMPENIRQPVTDGKVGDLIGPVKTALGYHVIHLTGINEPRLQSFEEVKQTIHNELVYIQTNDRLYDLSTVFDDLLAGGASLEESGQEVPLKVIDISNTDHFGLGKDGNNIFESYGPNQDKDREIILESAFELQQGEISRVLELPSGTFAAIELADVEEKASKPFEDVKQQIADQYIADQQRIENTRRVAGVLEMLQSGSTTFDVMAKTQNKDIGSFTNLKVSGEFPPPFTNETRPLIFQQPVGGVVSVPFEGGSALIEVSAAHLPEVTSEIEEKLLPQLNVEVIRELRQEAFIMYLEELNKHYKAEINQVLLSKAYGSENMSGQ